MHNLLLFLKRYNSFFVFLFLEIVCAFLIVKYNHFQRTQFLSSSGVLTAGVLNAKNNVTDYFSLKQQNQILSEQNALLLEQINNNKKDIPEQEMLFIPEPEIMTPKKYEFIPAKIIDKSTLKLHNYLTINKGSEDGIYPQMGVVGPKSIAGIVHKVSKNYATVMSVLHKQTHISAKIKKNNHFGSLTWDGKNEFIVQLNDVPNNVPVQKGDSIITSGFSDFFPEDILIGKVESVSRLPGSNFHSIEVELATVFRNLSQVYIINFKDYKEIKALENATLNE